MSDELSMPYDDGPSPSDTTSSFETDEGVGSEPTTDDTVTLDMPVASTTTLGDDSDRGTYGSRKDDFEEQYDEDGSTTDEVDVRKLFDKPSVDYIRWQYRQNGMAATVVDKPVKDAFKHSFDLRGDGAIDEVEQWSKSTYAPKQREARIKARRDGVSVLFWVLEDTNDVHEPIANPTGIEDIRVLTIDRLASGHGDPREIDEKKSFAATAQEAAEHVEYDEEQLVVTKSGIVIVDDITSTDHEDFVGVLYERNPQLATSGSYEFIHADRCELFVERDTVDGDLHDAAYGHVEGDSVLAPIVHALSGITKAEWALGQTLLRYTAPLHVVEIDKDATPKDGDWEEHIAQLNEQLDNVNNKSSLTLPPAHSADTLSADSEIDPEPFLNGLINDICAGAEITRSVLLGTQAGTVSGSSTDIKNYYNQVQRNRHNVHDEKLRAGIEMKARVDDLSVDIENIEWGPMFKIDALERTDAMMTVASAMSNGVNRYLLSIDEARDIIEEEWAELGVDVNLGELTEEDMDELDRVNTTKGKQYGGGEETPEDEYESKHLGQNGGGRSGGNTTDEANDR